MLSNKLTFSLASIVLTFVLALAFLATPAIAQRVGTDAVPDIAKDEFGIVGQSSTAASLGFVAPAAATEGSSMPDLADILMNGGAIELQMQPNGATPAARKTAAADAAKGAAPGATADEKKKSLWQKAVITEVMWGRDEPPVSGESADMRQWIEIYNFTGKTTDAAGDLDTDTASSGALRLVYYRNASPNMPDKVIETDFAAGTNDNADVDAVWVLVDRVSTTNRFGTRWSPPGQSGNTVAEGSPATAISSLISMYRKINLDAGKYKEKDGKLDGLGDGREAGSWAESEGRINMLGNYVGSPSSVHVKGGGLVTTFTKAPDPISATGVIINEVRNDNSEANLDWIELFYNTDDSAAMPQPVENWELRLVTDNKTDKSLAVLPKYKMQPGEYLVVYNRHPGKTVALAGGVNIQDVIDGKQVNKGATHKYVVAPDLDLPNTGKFLILLRTRRHDDDVGKPTNIKDYIGNGFFQRIEANKFDTDVWPFVAWTNPAVAGFGDNTFASRDMSWGRKVKLNKNGDYWAHSRANDRGHGDDWKQFPFIGTGYDRGKDKTVDPVTSPGTPGYPNIAVNVITDDRDGSATDKGYAFDGKISISEIMYDAGKRWNLVQWIELYNNSTTETIDLAGWEFEIRNESTDIESYVDASFEFKADTIIPPNQTLLLVSSTGANDVPSNYVYNLAQEHPKELGLNNRTKRLLSTVGFHLELRAKETIGGKTKPMMHDQAGNVMVEGAARTHVWDLPPVRENDSDPRVSIVRQYGSQKPGSGASDADDGTMETSWNLSSLSGASLTFYGHRNDVGSPGSRIGSPLPVSLSSFRPVRDEATGHVVVRWVTQSELNNAGFNILRSETKNGTFKVVNVKGIVPGHGTTSEKHVYEWKDTSAKPNVVYYYQIEDVSLNGERTTLTTTRLKGHVSAAGKLTTTWSRLKQRD